ncbi:MAG: glycine oxidase ThiO [Acidobacteriia bacterium]|nr:glycine oxidase ThiO [Terriglobia bacterium]
MKTWDTIIAGAGIIGVSLALELQERGARVLVLDSGEPGHEASSAAAGMLAAFDPETLPALRPLAVESARMFPEYVRKLEAAAQMQVDFRRMGTIAFLETASTPPEHKSLSTHDLERLEPSLRNHGHPAFFVQEDSVDPHLLMLANLAAACKAGIEIRGHQKVTSMRPCSSGVEVVTEADRFTARSAVDCRGAWSGTPVKPRKGQMLYVQPKTSILRHVLRAPEVYVVPRTTGKILIGATVEDVGYDKTVNPSAIQGLLNAAAKYLPELASAPITQSWAGLRPGTPDDLPIIGPTETPGLFVASGHFRNGILLAPVTARIVAGLIEGGPAPLSISAFSPARFSRQTA